MDRTRIGELVRNRREALGLTLREVPGVPHSTQDQVERGLLNATLNTMGRLAGALDARWEVALVPGAEAEMDPQRREVVNRLLAIIDRLDERDVRQLLRQVKGYEEEVRIQGQRTK